MASVATLAASAGVLQPSRTWAQSEGSRKVKTTKQKAVRVVAGGTTTKPTQADLDNHETTWPTTWPDPPTEPKPRNTNNPISGVGRPEFIGKLRITAFDPPNDPEPKITTEDSPPKLSARKMEDGLWYYVYEYDYVVDKVAKKP